MESQRDRLFQQKEKDIERKKERKKERKRKIKERKRKKEKDWIDKEEKTKIQFEIYPISRSYREYQSYILLGVPTLCVTASVTSKKSPNVYKSCPKVFH